MFERGEGALLLNNSDEARISLRKSGERSIDESGIRNRRVDISKLICQSFMVIAIFND